MPIIVDEAGRTTEVSEAQYNSLKREVAAERSDSVASLIDDGPLGQRLWDCVEEAWTNPLPQHIVHDKKSRSGRQQYLDKVLWKCSQCNFTSLYDAGVNQHVEFAGRQVEEHRGAEIRPSPTGEGRLCTGCGFTFRGRATQAQCHLERILEMGRTHARVEGLLIRRYAVIASEPTVLSRVLILDGPEARVVEPPRKSRRRRRSKRGNSNRTPAVG